MHFSAYLLSLGYFAFNRDAHLFIGDGLRVLGAFFNYVDKILAFYDHLPPYIDIFYLIRVD